jgi:hypothetical protein
MPISESRRRSQPRRRLFIAADTADVREEFNKIMSEVSAASLLLVGEPETVAKRIGLVRSRMDGIVNGINELLDTLREVEDFFQPAVLAAICKLANEYDNPKRRKSITTAWQSVETDGSRPVHRRPAGRRRRAASRNHVAVPPLRQPALRRKNRAS